MNRGIITLFIMALLLSGCNNVKNSEIKPVDDTADVKVESTSEDKDVLDPRDVADSVKIDGITVTFPITVSDFMDKFKCTNINLDGSNAEQKINSVYEVAVESGYCNMISFRLNKHPVTLITANESEGECLLKDCNIIEMRISAKINAEYAYGIKNNDKVTNYSDKFDDFYESSYVLTGSNDASDVWIADNPISNSEVGSEIIKNGFQVIGKYNSSKASEFRIHYEKYAE